MLLLLFSNEKCYKDKITDPLIQVQYLDRKIANPLKTIIFRGKNCKPSQQVIFERKNRKPSKKTIFEQKNRKFSQ